ncbi:MAG: hypothetical protein HKN87_24550 [Saprospiraceae bacterium]|nr:hypothetical protein [Saprospiraceae bacterium]
MKRLEDKILQFFIRGDSAAGKKIGKEISNDPSFNQADFDTYEKIWQASTDIADWKVADEDDAWAKIAAQTGLQETSVKRIPFWRRRSVAAILLLLVGFALYYWLTWDPYTTFRAEEATTVILPDSSSAEMTAGSEIRYLRPRFFSEAQKREIFLEGKAVFDVVDDPKPFEVVTSLTSVEVLGTVFSYEAEGDNSEAENVEGLVSFGSNTGAFEAVQLNPGDKASFDGNELVVELYEPEPEPVIIPEPSNKMRIIDLIDILSDKYPSRFIPGPGSDRSASVVIEVNLDQDLVDIIDQLAADEAVDIQYRKSGNSLLLSTISAADRGLDIDYSYDMYVNGVDYNRAPQQ